MQRCRSAATDVPLILSARPQNSRSAKWGYADFGIAAAKTYRGRGGIYPLVGIISEKQKNLTPFHTSRDRTNSF